MSQKKPIDQTAAPAEEQIMSGGRMLFTGPDYLRDHRVKVEEEHRNDFTCPPTYASAWRLALKEKVLKWPMLSAIFKKYRPF